MQIPIFVVFWTDPVNLWHHFVSAVHHAALALRSQILFKIYLSNFAHCQYSAS